MKKCSSFLAIFAIAILNSASAQQNIGIDVLFPMSKLDVHGAINTDSVFKINNTTVFKLTENGGVYIGKHAGENIPLQTSNRNTYVGSRSGMQGANAQGNSFFGYQAGEANNAVSNSFFGSFAGLKSATGSYNCFFGSSSGGYNATTQMNSFFGYLSGSVQGGTGDFNTILGAMSGVWPFTGDYNTFVGFNVNPVTNATADMHNSTAIGYQSRINASNQMRLGNGNITSIGGYTGWSNLSDGRFKKDVQQNVPGLLFINKLRPVTYHLDLTKLDDFFAEPDSITGNKQYSEARAAKEKLLQTGLIAQEVEKVAKEIGYDFSGIDAPADSTGNYSLRYAEFVVPLIKAVQELSKQNELLRQEIETIQKRIH